MELCDIENKTDDFSSHISNGKAKWACASNETWLLQYQTRNESTLADITDISTRFPISKWRQFCILSSQMLLQWTRQKVALSLLLLHSIVCGIAVGSLFMNSMGRSVSPVVMWNFIASVGTYCLVTESVVKMMRFPLLANIVHKEVSNRWYSLAPYYFASIVSKLPEQLLTTALFVLIVYVFSGIEMQLFRILLLCYVCLVFAFTTEGIAMMCSIRMPVNAVVFTAIVVVFPCLLGATYGFGHLHLLSKEEKTVFGMFFTRSAFYSIALVLLGYDRQDLLCDTDFCPMKNTSTALKYLELDGKSLWSTMLPMFVWLLISRMGIYCLLRQRFSGPDK